MPLYEVKNRRTNETYRVEAPYAQDACKRLGWMIGDCHVRILREGPYSNIAKAPERRRS